MNTQQLFDKVSAHLLKQNKQALSDDGCVYRASDGLMCAVGCLIKDEFYDVSLEKQNIYDDDVLNAVESSLGKELSGAELELLTTLQEIHDNCDPAEWREELMAVAREHNLKANFCV